MQNKAIVILLCVIIAETAFVAYCVFPMNLVSKAFFIYDEDWNEIGNILYKDDFNPVGASLPEYRHFRAVIYVYNAHSSPFVLVLEKEPENLSATIDYDAPVMAEQIERVVIDVSYSFPNLPPANFNVSIKHRQLG